MRQTGRYFPGIARSPLNVVRGLQGPAPQEQNWVPPHPSERSGGERGSPGPGPSAPLPPHPPPPGSGPPVLADCLDRGVRAPGEAEGGALCWLPGRAEGDRQKHGARDVREVPLQGKRDFTDVVALKVPGGRGDLKRWAPWPRRLTGCLEGGRGRQRAGPAQGKALPPHIPQREPAPRGLCQASASRAEHIVWALVAMCFSIDGKGERQYPGSEGL